MSLGLRDNYFQMMEKQVERKMEHGMDAGFRWIMRARKLRSHARRMNAPTFVSERESRL